MVRPVVRVGGQRQEWLGLVRMVKDESEAWWKCHMTTLQPDCLCFHPLTTILCIFFFVLLIFLFYCEDHDDVATMSTTSFHHYPLPRFFWVSFFFSFSNYCKSFAYYSTVKTTIMQQLHLPSISSPYPLSSPRTMLMKLNPQLYDP